VIPIIIITIKIMLMTKQTTCLRKNRYITAAMICGIAQLLMTIAYDMVDAEYRDYIHNLLLSL
jgi:hypothetical protein